MLFFGGYGVQAGARALWSRSTPRIWKESDVKREAFRWNPCWKEIRERGARAKLVVIDASRRNPYERRFRSFSHAWPRSMRRITR